MLSSLFQPRFLASLRVALLFARVMVVPPSPIAPLENFGFFDATGDGLYITMVVISFLKSFHSCGTEEVVNVFGNFMLEVAHDG